MGLQEATPVADLSAVLGQSATGVASYNNELVGHGGFRRADQFSNLRSTGILPVAEKHGQDARATPNAVTQVGQLIGPGGFRRSLVAAPKGSYNLGQLNGERLAFAANEFLA